jgi:hypothetical protein
MSRPKMSSRMLWRRETTSRRLRLWCALAIALPRVLSWWSDNLAEEDPLHNAQWRPSDRASHAHYPICYAKQIEAAQEAHVLLLRSVPKTRRARKATTGMDFGLVGVLTGILIAGILTA